MQTGVYTITNTINGKMYVGSAAQSFAKRWSVHKSQLRSGTHHSKYLQNAWSAHGSTAFKFEILEVCPPYECVSLEQFWLTTLLAYDRKYGYNARPTAASMFGYTHTKDAVEEIRRRNKAWRPTALTRERMRSGQLGRKQTTETKAKISKGHLGKTVVWTETARKKLSATLRKRTFYPKQTRTDRKPCIATNLSSGQQLFFESAWAAGMRGFCHSSVTRALRRVGSNKSGTHKGYRWDYDDRYETPKNNS